MCMSWGENHSIEGGGGRHAYEREYGGMGDDKEDMGEE